ncbi:DNA uptake lipoprotein [Paenibacillus sp. MER TA 81-3]|uniref:DNA uptake lipoprotein n=1 Tax=Paenibacillus sp. MER TA 81-3 TaxID=2939573 RepID=UPI00203EB737|nr:DNA uptake lipoprotein [Paenibacillus sp. MER TA 81-3]MCM3340337.1 DNA uptake lipoprotein [Paenibacillus sp. MER TA 81-3]
MQRPLFRPSLTAAILLINITLLLYGCSAQEGSMPPTSTEPSYTKHNGTDSRSATKKKDKKNEQTVIASPKENSSEGEGSVAEQTFDRTQPKLKGISLKSTDKDIRTLWGEPDNHFVMDEIDPIDVLEYGGFSFGCHQSGDVVFVEVSGEGQSTGIKGLKIGDNEDQAERTLGKPDHDTNYVWSYEIKSALLRLDMDPKTNKIQSVKLFPNNNV